jgi:hypothetical protein
MFSTQLTHGHPLLRYTLTTLLFAGIKFSEISELQKIANNSTKPAKITFGGKIFAYLEKKN